MEPKCRIWWFLVIAGGFIIASIMGLYGLHWANTCRANEIKIEMVENKAETKVMFQEILRRLDRIDKKIDEGN
jgi:aspartate aminotransferase-like enzyme